MGNNWKNNARKDKASNCQDGGGDPASPSRELHRIGFKVVWQRTRRRPTLRMLQEPAPPTECLMRCLPTSQGLPTGPVGHGSVCRTQYKALSRVPYLTGLCIQDRAVETSTSRTNNHQMD